MESDDISSKPTVGACKASSVFATLKATVTVRRNPPITMSWKPMASLERWQVRQALRASASERFDTLALGLRGQRTPSRQSHHLGKRIEDGRLPCPDWGLGFGHLQTNCS